MTDKTIPQIITKAQARTQGMKRFFTGIPCSHGHLDERYLSDGWCCACNRLARKKWKKLHRGQVNEGRRRNRRENRERFIAKQKEDHLKYAEREKAYRRKKKSVLNARSAAWRKNNPERVKASAKEYGEANKIAISLKGKAWKAANREKWLEQGKAWRKANPDRRAENRRNRRARETCAEGHHSQEDILRIMNAQRNICVGCLRKISFYPKAGEVKAHVDHVMPLSKGGSNWPSNLQCLCWKCNVSKGASDPTKWSERIKKSRKVENILEIG